MEEGERGFKLLLTQTDKQSLLALMQQKPQPAEPSLRITENFTFFEEWVQAVGVDLTPLCKGLAKLMIVDIALNRDQDNPQLIFESMNSTGRELSQADLIRNFILMDLATAQQTRLYEDHWRPMEVAFGQEAYGAHFNGFMRHYLTLKTGGEIPNIRAVYEAFKRHARTHAMEVAGGVDALVADIHAYADYYCAMALDKEPDKDLASAFQDLRELKVDVAFPFLLELYDDHSQGQLPKEDFVRAVRLVESYVFRRAVCAIPTNSLNKTFATFGRVLQKDRYIESIQAHLLTLPSYRRFPGDEEFKRDLASRDLYNFSRWSYWLRRLENHDRKERVPVDEYTIEHILPQNENLSATWHETLGPEWQRVQEDLATHPWKPHTHRLQLRVQRPTIRGEARHARRLQRESAASQRGARSLGHLERNHYPDTCKAARGAGRAGLGTTRAVIRGAGGLPPEGGTPRRIYSRRPPASRRE